MIFSADWYPTDPTTGWQLGAEVILDSPVIPKIRELKANTGTYLSMHSPMTVSIGSTKPGVRFMSTETICRHLTAMRDIQPGVTNRIVVHAANISDRTPEEVYEVQRKTLWSLWYKMRDAGLLDNSLICLENLGKINQVGTVEDICRLCSLTDNFIPCIDFGHLHGRSLGKFLNTKEEFESVFQMLYAMLPAWKVDAMHIHFSKLEYTNKGEKRHVPFSVKEAGPKPGNFLRALPERPGFNPVIVCESPNSYHDGMKLKRNFEARQRTIEDFIRP
jgi:deoxyribonuclease-4